MPNLSHIIFVRSFVSLRIWDKSHATLSLTLKIVRQTLRQLFNFNCGLKVSLYQQRLRKKQKHRTLVSLDKIVETLVLCIIWKMCFKILDSRPYFGVTHHSLVGDKIILGVFLIPNILKNKSTFWIHKIIKFSFSWYGQILINCCSMHYP